MRSLHLDLADSLSDELLPVTNNGFGKQGVLHDACPQLEASICEKRALLSDLKSELKAVIFDRVDAFDFQGVNHLAAQLTAEELALQ